MSRKITKWLFYLMKGSDIMRIEKLEFNKVKVTVFPVDLMDMFDIRKNEGFL